MKILHTVEFYHPSSGGMQEVVKQLSEGLVKLGQDVTVATTRLPERKEKIINRVKIIEFKVMGKMVEGLHGEIEKYKEFLINSDFDIITNFAAQQWASDLTFDILDEIKAKKVFVPQGFSGFYFPEYKNYFKNMKSWMKKYDMNVFPSNDYRDINFARKNNIKKIKLIPNGASEEEFLGQNNIDIREKLNIPKNHFLILHVGSHTGLKGNREAIEIFEKAKITNATFLIIGNSFGGGCTKYCFIKEKLFNLSPRRLLDKKRLIVVSLSREQTISAYKEANLFLFPSNIECSPLVLFECMASKTPFLTTDVGNAKEIIKWSKSGLLLPTIKDKNDYSKAKINESARLLENILTNSKRRALMGKIGFNIWKNKFTWEKITKEYESLYYRLINNKIKK